MKIQNNAFVSIDYTLSLDSGEVIDRSEPDKPMGFVYNAGQIIPGLEKSLLGMESGQSAKIDVEAVDGYGEERTDLVREVPRHLFPTDVNIQPGMIFQMDSNHGQLSFRVKDVHEDNIVIDLNHPLAGKRLHFVIKIMEVRDATEEELASSHEDECDDPDCQEHDHGRKDMM